ncbi:MAG: alpha/beta fold hydrolase [Burkholderiaceae bacterium]
MPRSPVSLTALLAALMAALMASISGCRNSDQLATDGLSACRLRGIDREVRCGSVRVPENPDAPDGPAIEVRFAVVPAVARNKEADSVLVLAGGPGQAATRIAGQVMPLFAKLNARRDIVFIDQRGTGGSNALECPVDETSLAESVEPARQIERLQRCLKNLKSDLAQYATWIAVRDFDAVRAKLNVSHFNLWGASYGTRAALEYLRQFPDRVRTVVLDGVAPPDMVLPASFAVDAEAALDRMIAVCQQDSACNRRHPDLALRINALLTRADAGFEITVQHPLTGAQETLRIDRGLLASLLRTPLYVPQLSALLPYALAEAGRGDFNPLVAMTVALSGAVSENFAFGMHLAVVCAEDQPLMTPALQNQARASRFGRSMVDLYAGACEAIPIRPVPPGFAAVGPTAVPVLILSGGLDPATPPRHGAAVAAKLGNARHLVAPNLAHGVSGQACVPDLITRFIRNAAFDGIDDECLRRLPAPRFFEPIVAPASHSTGAPK